MLMRAAQRLSAERDHPVYDCLYASLARLIDAPLITADERLIRKLSGLDGLKVFSLSDLAPTPGEGS
jgi:predicted nucleic acid-binding protein